jgi:hypothetical protein
MFWVMRQPTCVFGRDRADCGDRGLRAQRSPGTGDRIIPRFSIVSCTPPHVPPERSVPCRFAWPLPGGRAVILFKRERKVERRNASRNASTSGATGHVHAPPPGHVHDRTSISLGGLSFTLATRGTGAPGAGSSAATRHPAGAAAGGVRCHRTTPPPGPPAPRVPRSDRRARVESPYVDVVRFLGLRS